MADIVNLRGGDKIHAPGEVDEKVVALAQDVLDRAMAGVINGLAVSIRNNEGAHTYRLVGQATISTVGNIEMMKLDVIEQIK